jgi:hypothetical protein
MKDALSDAVIEAAVRRMPKAWFDRVGSEMIAALKERRDELPEQAERFFDFFSDRVDVRASEGDDVVEIDKQPDGGVSVRVALASSPGAPISSGASYAPKPAKSASTCWRQRQGPHARAARRGQDPA